MTRGYVCLFTLLLAACSSSEQSGSGGTGGTSGSGGVAGSGAGGTGGGAGTGGTSATGGSAGSGGASGGSGGNAGSGGSAGQAAVGCSIVPLYAYPDDASWSALAAAKQQHPSVNLVAIVNPDSGPGAAVDSTFTSGIGQLKSAGVHPIGYVSTVYATRPLADVQKDIDSYESFYPALEGVMFDEVVSDPGNESYYQAASQHAKAAGLPFIVGNPGAAIAQSYLASFDVLFIYESKGLPSLSTLSASTSTGPANGFGIIPYGVPSLDAGFVSQAKALSACIYVTDDDLPNPWDTLPSYFDSLLTALEK